MTATMEMYDQLETAPIPDLLNMATDDVGWQRLVLQEARDRDLEASLPRDFGQCPDWCATDHVKLKCQDEVHHDLPVRERVHERGFGPFSICRCDRLDLDGQLTKGTPYLLSFDDVTENQELAAARALYGHLGDALDQLIRVSTDVDTTAQVLAEQDAVAEQ